MWKWETDPDILTDEAWGSTTAEQRERCIALATSSLMMLTLNRVGLPPITVRPCPKPRPCGCWSTHVLWELDVIGPHLFTGYSCLSCSRTCEPLSEVDLDGPVGFIDRILVDGTDVPLDDFRLDDGHLLVWQGDGPSPIPETQDLSKPDSEPGTWSITYSRSYAVDDEARLAVSLLALEFAAALKPRGKCSLPRGVQSVTRQGVSFTINASLFPGGLTEIEMVDAFILKWAPAGAPNRSAQVFSPRAARKRISASIPRRPGGIIDPEVPTDVLDAIREFEEGLSS